MKMAETNQPCRKYEVSQSLADRQTQPNSYTDGWVISYHLAIFQHSFNCVYLRGGRFLRRILRGWGRKVANQNPPIIAFQTAELNVIQLDSSRTLTSCLQHLSVKIIGTKDIQRVTLPPRTLATSHNASAMTTILRS